MLSIRTCCANHASVDAQDEQMQMDEMARVNFLEDHGHADYHYICPAGEVGPGSVTKLVVGAHEGQPALFTRNQDGYRGEFVRHINFCGKCGQKLTAEDESGIPDHWA